MVSRKATPLLAIILLFSCSNSDATECSNAFSRIDQSYKSAVSEDGIGEAGSDESGRSNLLASMNNYLKSELEKLPYECRKEVGYTVLMSRAESSNLEASLNILSEGRERHPDSALIIYEMLKSQLVMQRHYPGVKTDIENIRKDVALLQEGVEEKDAIVQVALFHSELELLTGHYNEAIMAANVALETDASDPRSYALAAQVEAARGRYEAALSILASDPIEKAGLQVWYDNPRAILAAAQAYCGLNKPENAKQLFASLHPTAPKIMHYDSFYKQAYETASGCQPEESTSAAN